MPPRLLQQHGASQRHGGGSAPAPCFLCQLASQQHDLDMSLDSPGTAVQRSASRPFRCPRPPHVPSGAPSTDQATLIGQQAHKQRQVRRSCCITGDTVEGILASHTGCWAASAAPEGPQLHNPMNTKAKSSVGPEQSDSEERPTEQNSRVPLVPRWLQPREYT